MYILSYKETFYLSSEDSAQFRACLTDSSCALSCLWLQQKRIRFTCHGLRCSRVPLTRHVALWLQGVSSNKNKRKKKKKKGRHTKIVYHRVSQSLYDVHSDTKVIELKITECPRVTPLYSKLLENKKKRWKETCARIYLEITKNQRDSLWWKDSKTNTLCVHICLLPAHSNSKISVYPITIVCRRFSVIILTWTAHH